MATGNDKPDSGGVVVVTENNLLRDATVEYLTQKKADLLQSGQPVDPAQVEFEMLGKLQRAVDAYNVAVGLNGNKDLKCRQWTVLPNYAIAQILLELYVIRVLVPDSTSRDRSMGVLAMYDVERGVYSTVESDIDNLIQRYNSKAEKRDADEVKRLLRNMAPLAEQERDRDLIAVNNGIFDYRTKQLMPFSPEHVFVSKSAVDYVDNAPLPVMTLPDGSPWDVESWLLDLMDGDGELCQLIWQIIGATLRPNVRWNKAAWFYSEEGNNGKGTLCEFMRNLVGRNACASIPLDDFSKDFMLEDLMRAQAVIVDENNVGGYLDKAANLKAVITNDVIFINRKFKTPVAYQFHGFMVQCVNDMPKTRDKSDSFYRRQLFVPFRKCFTGKEIPEIKEIYLSDRGVLEYALHKVLNMDYYTLSEPQACRDALNSFKLNNDSVLRFLDEMLPQCVWDLLPFKFLYDLYKAWFSTYEASGMLVSSPEFRRSVIRAVRNIQDWVVPVDKTGQPAVVRDAGRMSKPEPLLDSYNLSRWQNPAGRSSSWQVRCTPIQGGRYRGLLRVTAVQAADEEEQ